MDTSWFDVGPQCVDAVVSHFGNEIAVSWIILTRVFTSFSHVDYGIVLGSNGTV